jgi:4-amino-4-deoxy-L-arabinose transferase-like glycosyltransferase
MKPTLRRPIDEQASTASLTKLRGWSPRAVPRRFLGAGRTQLAGRGLEILAVLVLLCAGGYLRVTNLFNYPRYQLDEGTYVSSAWAVAHGAISPYTYTYGHPPVGWAMMALWIQSTGGFFTFGTAINSGRVLMVWLALLCAVLVYRIAHRLSNSPWAGLLAMALFTLSPLAVNYQRQVLLDNIATFWALAALYFLVSSESQLRYILGSALALGLSVLSKETMIILFPAFVYGCWLYVSRFQRRFVVIVFIYASLALVSLYFLLALLKGELFPTGTLLGGSQPHVSLIATFEEQGARGADQGALVRQWAVWWNDDPIFMALASASLAGNLLLSWRVRATRVVALLAFSYWLFLARGGVTLAYYLLPLIPLGSLNVAVFLHTLLSEAAKRLPRVRFSPGPWAAQAILLAVTLLLMPPEFQGNQANLHANETQPQIAALQWIGAHVSRSSVIVVNHYEWVDLRAEGGLATSYGAPFSHAHMYWQVATDPAIKVGVLHDDWNSIDYIVADSDMMKDVQSFHMNLLVQAFDHADVAQGFANQLYWVTIYRVRHR